MKLKHFINVALVLALVAAISSLLYLCHSSIVCYGNAQLSTDSLEQLVCTVYSVEMSAEDDGWHDGITYTHAHRIVLYVDDDAVRVHEYTHALETIVSADEFVSYDEMNKVSALIIRGGYQRGDYHELLAQSVQLYYCHPVYLKLINSTLYNQVESYLSYAEVI